jgi:hypothetical protein
MKTEDFKVVVNGEEKTFTVRSPSLVDQREGQKVYNQAFTDAIKSKSVVRAKMDDLLQDQGLWNTEKQQEYTSLQKELLDGERKLAKGGFSLSEAKKLAIRMREVRNKIRELISVRTSLDNHSAEGQADNARFNYLVSACVVYKDSDKKYFESLEDYMSRIDDPVALSGAQKLANMIYGLDNNFEKNLPENKFLKKYKFVNDDLRFIDKKGRTVDGEGRLIDEQGRYINEAGEFVDRDGNQVDEAGEYVVDAQPFLDDNGNPVVFEEETVPQPVISNKEEKVATNETPSTEPTPVSEPVSATSA